MGSFYGFSLNYFCFISLNFLIEFYKLNSL